jgi:hypothetical protein
MLSGTFYFGLIRKYVILMGTLVNNIRIIRTDKTGTITEILKVPVTYAPKDKMLARVIGDPTLSRQSAAPPLPLISFEIGEMKYDATRKLNTVGRSTVKSTDKDKFNYQYNPVPYNINFKVYIYAKNADDGTKIIEQILPYFTPDWTTTVNLIPEMEIIMDIPILLNNIHYEDKYDGEYKDRRSIIWTLDFVLKGYLYGPVKSAGVIKFVETNFYIPSVADGKLPDAVGNTHVAERVTVQPGLTIDGKPTSNLELTIPYQEIESTDDYGFVNVIYNMEQLE